MTLTRYSDYRHHWQGTSIILIIEGIHIQGPSTFSGCFHHLNQFFFFYKEHYYIKLLLPQLKILIKPLLVFNHFTNMHSYRTPLFVYLFVCLFVCLFDGLVGFATIYLFPLAAVWLYFKFEIFFYLNYKLMSFCYFLHRHHGWLDTRWVVYEWITILVCVLKNTSITLSVNLVNFPLIKSVYLLQVCSLPIFVTGSIIPRSTDHTVTCHTAQSHQPSLLMTTITCCQWTSGRLSQYTLWSQNHFDNSLFVRIRCYR